MAKRKVKSKKTASKKTARKKKAKPLRDCSRGDSITLGKVEYHIDDDGKLVELIGAIHVDSWPLKDLKRAREDLRNKLDKVDALIAMFTKKMKNSK
jgi:hypothetical protein